MQSLSFVALYQKAILYAACSQVSRGFCSKQDQLDGAKRADDWGEQGGMGGNSTHSLEEIGSRKSKRAFKKNQTKPNSMLVKQLRLFKAKALTGGGVKSGAGWLREIQARYLA